MYRNYNTGGDDNPLNRTQLYWQQVSLNNHLNAALSNSLLDSIEMVQLSSLWLIVTGGVEFKPQVNHFSL